MIDFRKFILGIFALIAVSALAIFVPRDKSERKPGRSREQVEAPLPPVELNSVLSNELCDNPAVDRLVRQYMAKWGLKGAQLSVIRRDSLVYSKGYGIADQGVDMQPSNILRVASVSKLITAVGIMHLAEEGRLSLSDKVFGPEGILSDEEYTAQIKDQRHFDITVEHLLRHQGGFSIGHGDPMFNIRDIMLQNRLTEAPDSRELTKIVLRRKLSFDPGSSQHYSNFGYLLLTLVVEAASGLDYETYMRDCVLSPAGVFDMHQGGNYYEDKLPGEVRYYPHAKAETGTEFNLSGRTVTLTYGGNDVRGLRGAGSWVCSTPELARLVASIDGRPEVPDILSPESVAAMTEYIDDEHFALGWNDVKPDGEWTRTGSYVGTTALVKRLPEGDIWVFVANTSTYIGANLARHTTELFRSCRPHIWAASDSTHTDLFNYRPI